MKTLYSLGGSPQFRLPCLKYGFLIKEKDNKFKNILPKNNNTIIKDFYEFDENEKEENLVDQWMDAIYPLRSIKRCVQINPTMKLNMRKFYRHLRESLSIGRNKTANKIKKNIKLNINNENIKTSNINNIYNINEGKKLKNMKFIFNRNNYNFKDALYNIINYNSKYNKTNNYFRKEENIKLQIEQSKSLPKKRHNELKAKLSNYNYPITNESGSLDLCQQKTKLNSQLLSISNNNNNNNNNNSLSNNSNSRIMFNSKFWNFFENNKGLNEFSKSDIKNNIDINTINKLNNAYSLTNITQKRKNPLKIKKCKYSNSIENVMDKNKKLRDVTQHNKLNILYSENEEQFYRKYDKHVKTKFLNGLCLTHINSSPKVILNDLNLKIKNIKNKIGVVKSIVDKTFPKVLADISLIKKEYENSLGKQGFNSPYIERLNKIKNKEKKMEILFSGPFKIISRNKNTLTIDNKQ